MPQLEQYIIEYCSPTLAGMKAGGLFTYKFKDRMALGNEMCRVNKLLNAKGVFVTALRIRKNCALIYVFRPALLCERFHSDETCRLMNGFGYCSEQCGEECVNKHIRVLRERLSTCDGFPHEIGIFLGYPLEDVQGFIEHCGSNCKLCGPWKVYGDVEKAEGLFRKYSKCSDVYRRQFSNGKDITKLTISA